MDDGKTVLHPQEGTFKEPVRQPGCKYCGYCDDAINQYGADSLGELDAGVAIEGGKAEYQQRMDDIDTVGYLAHEVTHTILKVDYGVVKLTGNADN